MLMFDHSNKSYREVLCLNTVYFTLQGGSNFALHYQVWLLKSKLWENAVLSFESMNKIGLEPYKFIPCMTNVIQMKAIKH